MKRQAPIPVQKETIPPQMRGFSPHNAVHNAREHEMPANASMETQFTHDFSRVSVQPSTPGFGQDNSNVSCPLLPQRYPFGGACHTCQTRVQAKLKIGKPGDKYEQEADSVANRVMNMQEPLVRGQMEDKEEIQIKPLADQITPIVQKQTEEEELENQFEEEEEPVQAKEMAGSNQKGTLSVERDINAVRGGGRPLLESTRSFFEPRFGADFSTVRVHTDSKADHFAKSINAKAFTFGRNVVLGSGQYSPETASGRQLLAHELTHTIQQGSSNKRVQRYTDYDSTEQATGKSLGWTHPASDDIKVADDGTMVVGDSGSDAWALKARITHAERILKSINSDIKLEEGVGTLSGKAPKEKGKGGKKTIKEVKVTNRVGGGRADLTADCGTTARQVLGIDTSSEKFSAVMKRKGRGVEKYTPAYKYYGDPYTTPERWTEDIYKREFGAGLTGAQAKAQYDALSPAKKRKFDRKYGINRYAVPRVGQAIAADSPTDWNFHFAGTILKGGHDYITAENFPAAGRTSQSWYFEMYGPRSKAQTFYHEWKDVSGSTVMVAESEKARQGKTNRNGVRLVGVPRQAATTVIVSLPAGTHVDVLKRGRSWRKVEVKSGAHAGKRGWIMSKYYEVR